MADIQFDHVVILVPYDYLEHPPGWLAKNFTISAGGRHGDGRTENRLILLRDGTYIELIAFVDDDDGKRAGHRWDGRYGIVDYALTTPGSFDFEGLQQRLKAAHTGIEYSPPRAGGRKRPDGVELKWQVTVPDEVPSGEVPFWCHDVTPRERRVPVSQENSTHPCGAVGVGGMQLCIASDRVSPLESAIRAITDNHTNVGTPLKPGHTAALAAKGSEDVGTRHVLKLSLRCQAKTPADIEETIGDGHLSIHFLPSQA